MILVATSLAVGGVKTGYALMAQRGGRLLFGKAARVLNALAGLAMVVVGGFLLGLVVLPG